MTRSLRRSQHHQRRKETQTATEAASAAARYKTGAARQPQQTTRRWTPWVLDSKGLFFWSAMRRPDGTLEYAYCDNQGRPFAKKSPVPGAPAVPVAAPAPAAPVSSVIDRVLLPVASASSPEVQSSGLLSSIARPVSSSGVSLSDATSSSSTGSYLSLWYQDLQKEGVIGERRKLDMRVSRWLASLA